MAQWGQPHMVERLNKISKKDGLNKDLVYICIYIYIYIHINIYI